MNKVKKVLALTAAAATLFAAVPSANAAENDTVNISDRHATAETRALFAKLSNTKSGELRFGQQHATDEKISPTATNGDVYEMTGQYPAVFGWDAGLALLGSEKPGAGSDESANINALAMNIVDADAKGAIVTLSAHWNNPVTGGDAWDNTTVAGELLPGAGHSATYNKLLDGIAATANKAKRADGTSIPIIFRPLHENTGSWFWWGAAQLSKSEYKELFRYTVNYLRDVKGVHNLLYAYSPGGTYNGDPTDYLATYPGDQWVDVLGYDEYMSDSNDLDAWVATVTKDMKMITKESKARGKIAALTEFGRTGAAKITKEEDKYPQIFSKLADSLAKEAPEVAYMQTWANFGGGDFQAYTPWKGSAGEKEFVKFANSNKNLMASKPNVDYSHAPAATAIPGTVRIVTPTAGERVEDDEITVRVKADDVALGITDYKNATVLTSANGKDGKAISIPLSYSCNGYFMGRLNFKELGIPQEGTLTLTPKLFYKNGKPVAAADGDITIKLGAKPQMPAGTVEDFDTYDSNEDLQAVFSPNHSTCGNFTLTQSPEGDKSGNAGNLHYDYTAYPEYNGFQRAYNPKQDWSGYSAMELYLKPDGSDQKLVIQVNAGGVSFEAYPSLKDTKAGVVKLPFDEPGVWNVASWDTANAGKKLDQKLLSKVGAFALYVNDNGEGRPQTGDLVFDSIKLTGERAPYVSPDEPAVEEPVTPAAEPKTVDDFAAYADDAALREAWGNRKHTEVLSLTEGLAENAKAMEFKYDFSEGNWHDVAKYLDGADWSGQGKLVLDVKGNNDGNAIGLQIGTMDGTYFMADIKLDFDGWKTVEIPLVGNDNLTQNWPEDENRGRTMSNADLKSIKELVIASQKWNDDSKGINFAIANINVTSGASEGTTDKDDAKDDQDDQDNDKDDANNKDDNQPAEDTVADIANGDPASCPIVDIALDDPSDTKDPAESDKPANKQDDDTQHSDSNKDSMAADSKKETPAQTGAPVMTLALVTLGLLALGGSVYYLAKRREI